MKKHSEGLRRSAFSLPEVTMAMGIVATVALPVLAMLAGGSAMQGTARDRETAARIARECAAALVATPDGSGRFWTPGPGLRIPLAAGDAVVHAAFDADGEFLAQIDAGTFSQGEPMGGSAVHLARLSVSPSSGQPGLAELEIVVEQPAAAAEEARSRERFRSRLAAPLAAP